MSDWQKRLRELVAERAKEPVDPNVRRFLSYPDESGSMLPPDESGSVYPTARGLKLMRQAFEKSFETDPATLEELRKIIDDAGPDDRPDVVFIITDGEEP